MSETHWWPYDETRFTLCGLSVRDKIFSIVPTCRICHTKLEEQGRDVAALESPQECPYCGRLMSEREAREQHACDDCLGGR
jgi:hypothetical protein